MRRNVLITAASRRVPLVDAFQRVLRETGGGRVIVTDVNAMSPAVHVADAAFRVPLATDPGYVEALGTLCAAHDVGLLVPTIDDELEVIGAARQQFEAAGVRVAASPTETAAICNDKLRTVAGAAGARRARRRVVAAGRRSGRRRAFPLFVKPRNGRGGVGAFPARTRRELDFFTELRRPARRPGVSRRSRVHDRHALPRRACRSRSCRASASSSAPASWTAAAPSRDRSLIDLGLACAAALEFHGPGQHPVPDASAACRGLRDQPAVLRRHPADHCRRRRLSAHAGRPRAADGRSSPNIGHFTDGLWMTSYEAAIFLQADQAVVFPRPGGAIQEVA